MTSSRLALFPLISLLAACGGSSGGSGPIPTPPTADTTPPTLSGGPTVDITVAENTAGSIQTISATDNSGAPTLALTATGDSAAFQFDPDTGALQFANPPDFEQPADADGDNVYIIEISATDSAGNQATQSLTITVTDEAGGAALEQVVTGLGRPIGLVPIPGDTRLAIVEQRGRIRLLDPATGLVDSVDFLSVTDLATGGEQGLLGLAFPDDFQTSGTFYIHLTAATGAGRTEIRRYQTVTGRRDQGDPATADLIIAIDQPRGNHNAGWIGFAGDGNLIVPTGDGGGAGDPDGLAQNRNSLLGKILRLDVSSDDFPADDDRDYAIPTGNVTTGAAEIYALGLRNPFQSTIDPQSGDLIIADVGQGEREEINRLSLDPALGSGTNFGWNLREGTRDYEGGADSPAFTGPVAEYGHDSSDRGGFSVTGGVVYGGTVEDLQGQYLFADFVTDNIWAVPVADLINGETVPAADFTVVNPPVDTGDVGGVSSFATGLDGTGYVVMLRGDVYRIVTAE